MGEALQHPAAQAALAIGAGAGSAYSRRGAAATGAVLNTLKFGDTLRKGREKGQRRKSFLESLNSYTAGLGEEMTPDQQLFVDAMKYSDNPAAGLSGLAGIGERSARPTAEEVLGREAPAYGTTRTTKTRGGESLTVKGVKPEAPRTVKQKIGDTTTVFAQDEEGGLGESLYVSDQPDPAEAERGQAANSAKAARQTMSMLMSKYRSIVPEWALALEGGRDLAELVKSDQSTAAKLYERMPPEDKALWDVSMLLIRKEANFNWRGTGDIPYPGRDGDTGPDDSAAVGVGSRTLRQDLAGAIPPIPGSANAGLGGGTLPEGVPPGSTIIREDGGRTVYKTPDGRYLVDE